MRNPLIFQPCEYSCCPSTFINAITYLYHRHEIPSQLIKQLHLWTMDNISKGIMDFRGTTGYASFRISCLINDIKTTKFDATATYYEEDDVTPEVIDKALMKNGCAVVTVKSVSEWHCVLVTGDVDDDYLVWDPYYRTKLKKIDGYRMPEKIDPFRHNLLVNKKHMFSFSKKRFSIDYRPEHREIVTFWRNN